MARLSRRGVVLVMATAALAAGCTSPPSAPTPDPLQPMLNAAAADATTAGAAAKAFADNAATLSVIASVRKQQATALRTEVDRAAAVTSPPAVSSSAAPAPTDEASVTATLLADLTTEQQDAAKLMASLPRYRAGLVGSVAAGCASLAEALHGGPITAATTTPTDGTPATDPTTTQAPPPAALPADTVTALQQALSAEHAALWLYGTASAFVTGSDETEIIAAMSSVQTLRDATEHRISAGGATPVPAQPAYIAPQPVTGQTTALAALAVAESDATVAWRSVLEHTDTPALRAAALSALIDSAVRETRWRRLAGQSPASIAMPGAAG